MRGGRGGRERGEREREQKDREDRERGERKREREREERESACLCVRARTFVNACSGMKIENDTGDGYQLENGNLKNTFTYPSNCGGRTGTTDNVTPKLLTWVKSI